MGWRACAVADSERGIHHETKCPMAFVILQYLYIRNYGCDLGGTRNEWMTRQLDS
jgi:hypothetical protein